ncbi:hypothetical protein PWT90_07042 [Aphanocladium album]|nr:hypothetical protein PWT90_07042 [Aphanocladium album]
MKISAIFLSAFVAASLGMPTATEHVLHQQRSERTFMNKLGAVDSTKTVPVRFALKQRNLEHGTKLLAEVSDPDSPKYGQHYSQDQVAELFAPEQSTIDAVKKWLISSGIPESSISSPKSKGWLDFKTTVGTLESLLKTSYNMYENTKTSATYLGADKYHLPSDIASVVDFVTPAASLLRISGGRSSKPLRSVKRAEDSHVLSPAEIANLPTKSNLKNCNKFMTPDCIAAQYKIPAAPTKVNPKNTLGVLELYDEYFKGENLDLFFSKVAKNIPKGTRPKIDLIDWPNGQTPNADNANGEAELDFDMAIPIIYPQRTEIFSVHGEFDPFLDAIDGGYCENGDEARDCGTFAPAPVFSISWGGTETDDQPAAFQRQCAEYMKLGLQGTTVVASSGDSGVIGNNGCAGTSEHPIFAPGDPVACPYVTSVGATILAGRVGGPETVTTEFSPGGGFSNIFGQPDWQKSAVEGWFASHAPDYPTYNATDGNYPADGKGGYYNRIGRAYPDLAAAGDYGVVAFKGEITNRGDGTSMSAPIVAGMITLINEARLAAGKSLVGFINPALYKNPSMFNDVVTGGMHRDQRGGCDGKSFDAAPGWDPVTGLGTPDYAKMSKYFMSL